MSDIPSLVILNLYTPERQTICILFITYVYCDNLFLFLFIIYFFIVLLYRFLSFTIDRTNRPRDGIRPEPEVVASLSFAIFFQQIYIYVYISMVKDNWYVKPFVTAKDERF